MRLYRKIFFSVLGISILGKAALGSLDAYEPYTFPSEIPEKYQIEAEKRYDQLVTELTKTFPDKDDGQISRYAERQIYGLKNIVESGKIYLGWAELEKYLNNVTNKLLPSGVSEEEVQVYAATGTDVNAFAFHDGTILVNIGLLAEAESEAEVAFILAHELSHYFYQDVRKQYFNSLEAKTKKNRNDKDFLREKALEQSAYSRSMERRADSFSFHLTRQAGYKIEPGIVGLYKMLAEEQQFKDMGGGAKTVKTVMVTETDSGKKEEKTVDEYLFSSHPELNKRTQMLRTMREENDMTNTQQDFLVSQKKFQALREKARYEKVHLLLERNEIRSAIEKSFAYHLQAPENGYFQSNLLKGLRRAFYIRPNIRNHGFLTYIYDQDPFKADTTGILKDLHYVLPDSIGYANIKATHFLDDEHEFETYQEAFDYFSKKCLNQELPESFLTMALYLREKPEEKTRLLKKYLAQDNIKHRNYAKALMKDSLEQTIDDNRNLVLLNQLKFIEDHTYGYHRRFLKEAKTQIKYVSKARTYIEDNHSGKEFITTQALKTEDLGTLVNMFQIFNTVLVFQELLEEKDEEAQSETYYMNQEAEEKAKENQTAPRSIFYYKPEIWQHFKKENLASIAYMNVITFDDKTDIVGYLNFLNPLFYLRAFKEFFDAFSVGPERFHFNVFYYKFSPNANEKIQEHEEDVGYKMTVNNFINALYYTLSEEKSDKE